MPSTNTESAFSDATVIAPLAPKPVSNATPCLVTRHGMACEALLANKPFAAEALVQYLSTWVETFGDYTLREPANGLLDSKVLEAIDAFEPDLKRYRETLAALATHPAAADLVKHLLPFFRDIVRFKHDVANTQQCVLWADGYRFLLRELFLTTIAILIRNEAYDAVAVLLEADYSLSDEGPALRFTVFDGYAKTLDEFRNRRLQLQRMSVSSDVMRERADPSVCDFESLMQADFILCIRSLVCEPSFFVRWYPRLLVYADDLAMTGFELFVRGSNPERFGPIATMLDCPDREMLLERFNAVYEAWALERWEVGGTPLDFRGYMGLNNRALQH
jgi:hypothetical protein